MITLHNRIVRNPGILCLWVPYRKLFGLPKQIISKTDAYKGGTLMQQRRGVPETYTRTTSGSLLLASYILMADQPRNWIDTSMSIGPYMNN